MLACDDWVVNWTVYELRRAYPHLGITAQESVQASSIYQAANEFVSLMKQAFKNLGETVSDATSSGLVFTGLYEHDERSDPDNDSYEQPKFRRGQFDYD